ncbi:hypothetical protein AURDEDRAFT_165923, partial [Auricularia subglabra TFB-10046 SS5]
VAELNEELRLAEGGVVDNPQGNVPERKVTFAAPATTDDSDDDSDVVPDSEPDRLHEKVAQKSAAAPAATPAAAPAAATARLQGLGAPPPASHRARPASARAATNTVVAPGPSSQRTVSASAIKTDEMQARLDEIQAQKEALMLSLFGRETQEFLARDAAQLAAAKARAQAEDDLDEDLLALAEERSAAMNYDKETRAARAAKAAESKKLVEALAAKRKAAPTPTPPPSPPLVVFANPDEFDPTFKLGWKRTPPSHGPATNRRDDAEHHQAEGDDEPVRKDKGKGRAPAPSHTPEPEPAPEPSAGEEEPAPKKRKEKAKRKAPAPTREPSAGEQEPAPKTRKRKAAAAESAAAAAPEPEPAASWDAYARSRTLSSPISPIPGAEDDEDGEDSHSDVDGDEDDLDIPEEWIRGHLFDDYPNLELPQVKACFKHIFTLLAKMQAAQGDKPLVPRRGCASDMELELLARVQLHFKTLLQAVVNATGVRSERVQKVMSEFAHPGFEANSKVRYAVFRRFLRNQDEDYVARREFDQELGNKGHAYTSEDTRNLWRHFIATRGEAVVDQLLSQHATTRSYREELLTPEQRQVDFDRSFDELVKQVRPRPRLRPRPRPHLPLTLYNLKWRSGVLDHDTILIYCGSLPHVDDKSNVRIFSTHNAAKFLEDKCNLDLKKLSDAFVVHCQNEELNVAADKQLEQAGGQARDRVSRATTEAMRKARDTELLNLALPRRKTSHKTGRKAAGAGADAGADEDADEEENTDEASGVGSGSDMEEALEGQPVTKLVFTTVQDGKRYQTKIKIGDGELPPPVIRRKIYRGVQALFDEALEKFRELFAAAGMPLPRKSGWPLVDAIALLILNRMMLSGFPSASYIPSEKGKTQFSSHPPQMQMDIATAALNGELEIRPAIELSRKQLKTLPPHTASGVKADFIVVLTRPHYHSRGADDRLKAYDGEYRALLNNRQIIGFPHTFVINTKLPVVEGVPPRCVEPNPEEDEDADDEDEEAAPTSPQRSPSRPQTSPDRSPARPPARPHPPSPSKPEKKTCRKSRRKTIEDSDDEELMGDFQEVAPEPQPPSKSKKAPTGTGEAETVPGKSKKGQGKKAAKDVEKEPEQNAEQSTSKAKSKPSGGRAAGRAGGRKEPEVPVPETSKPKKSRKELEYDEEAGNTADEADKAKGTGKGKKKAAKPAPEPAPEPEPEPTAEEAARSQALREFQALQQEFQELQERQQRLLQLMPEAAPPVEAAPP